MEILKNIIEYFSLFFGVLLILLMISRLANLFQQSHYHFSSIPLVLKYYYYRNGVFLLPLAPLVFLAGYWYAQLLYLIYSLALLYFYEKRPPIIKLKITPRVRRLLVTLFLISIISGTLLHFLLPLPQLHSSLAIVHLSLPLFVFLAAAIAYPVEYAVARYYQLKAGKKLKKYNPTVIGVTGSYGKTTTKNILFTMMREKEMVLCTDKSYNTPNGIALNVNQKLYPDYGWFIAEMGASRKGDIKKLVNFLRPRYGVVTSVGPQHLKSFKSMDNIIAEKTALIDGLPADGVGVINVDCEHLSNREYKTSARIVTFGINREADYRAINIVADTRGLRFTVRYPGGEAEIETLLLGRHNVYNLLASFALAKELGVPVSEIVFQAARLEPVKNRLSVAQDGRYTILEDAYNSNPAGFASALEVLARGKKPRVLITPGIVETGPLEKEINYGLAEKIAAVCDYVVLISSPTGLIIKKGLEDYGFSNFSVVKDYREAIARVKSEFPAATVLVENDIADIYKI